jgi:glycosyltransferase involved in cell wall biosynthesis
MLKIGIDARVFSKQRPDGTSRYLSGILKYLAPKDKSIRYFLLSNRPIENTVHNIESLENIEIVIDKSFLPGTLWFLFRCGKLAIKIGLDFFWAPYPAIPLFRSGKTKYVVTVLDLSFHLFPGFLSRTNRILAKSLFPYSIRKADLLFSISRFTTSELIKHFSIPPDKVFLAYPTFSSSFLPKACNEGNRPKPYLLFVGTFEPRKNIHFLIDNFLAVRDHLPSFTRLVLAGKIGWKFKFKKSVDFYRKNNIDILFSPGDEEIAGLYNSALLFILPSHYEGFGIPILEAMSFGVPVLCSNTGSLPEVGGDAAIYFDPFDGRDFKHKLLDLANSQDQRGLLIDKQLANLDRFNPEDSAESVLNAFLNCL